jgi:glycosyltransferase involved in cell wall biosynthesis
MLSVIIPSRVDQYLQKTIDDLLVKAQGEIEIIVILDGYWPDPIIKDDPRVVIVHQGEVHRNYGMRKAIDAGMGLARGEYVMKIDEHCLVDEGFDIKLIADYQDKQVVIPRRYRLDADNWTIIEDGRPPIDYMYVEYPYLVPYDRTQGLHGEIWKKDGPDIDDTPTMQGSCYFLSKSYWDELFPNGMDEENYGTFTQEAQEISMKVWLSGGEVKVNKKTFYAHFHKGKRGKGYGFSTEQYRQHEAEKEKGRLYCINYWLNTKDYAHDFAWFINEKFPDMPHWEGWQNRIEKDAEHDWSRDPSRQPSEWL